MYLFKNLIMALVLSFLFLGTSLVAFGELSSESSFKTIKIASKAERFAVGDVTDVYLQGREFEYYDKLHIEFYPEDLDRSGSILLQGFLDSNDEDIDVEELCVEVTTDGGATWTRATGHEEWDWSFRPEIGVIYDFALRVAKVKDNPLVIPSEISIGGFRVVLDERTTYENAKLSGSGSITIPYISAPLRVVFSNISLTSDGIVSEGTIRYSEDFSFTTDLVSINVYDLVFSPTGNSSIDASIEFTGELASLGRLSLSERSKLLPSSLNLSFPFTGKTINIWEEKDVELAISAGSVNIQYTLGDSMPKATFDIPTAQFNLGSLLRYADNNGAIGMMMGDFSGRVLDLSIPRASKLLDTGMTLPAGMSLSINLADFNNPSFTFNSSVNLSQYSNIFMRGLSGANIEASVSNSGLRATVSASGDFEPITIINRGGSNKDVKLVLEGDSPSFSIVISNNLDVEPSFDLNGITAKIYFGDLLNESIGSVSNIYAEISDFNNPTIEIPSNLYLFDSKMKLSDSFSASINLDDITSPIISFATSVDFSRYNDNIIAQHISGARIEATLSASGFDATITSNKPSPINIYEPKGVKLVFKGVSGPSFGISVAGAGSLPDIDITGIDAEVDFGTLLTDTVNNAQNVIASAGVIVDGEVQSIHLSLPAKVKLLNSNFAMEGMSVDLNLQEKKIAIHATANLDEYRENPIIRALSGAAVNLEITTSRVHGTIAVDESLDNSATILDLGNETQDVRLSMSGKPTVSFSVASNDVSFDIAGLNASINFGDLLKNSSSESIIAQLSSASSGSYSLEIPNKVNLMGTGFELENTTATYDLNSKTISFLSSVNLDNYDNLLAQAFDGASFEAILSLRDGFSATLKKEGELKPITILDRGASKDITLTFTQAPEVGMSIKNGDLDFDISGGSAELAFGDFLDGAIATLEALEDVKGKVVPCQYSWDISGKHSVIGNSKAKLSATSGSLNICDVSDPIIGLTSSVDLSGYGGLFKTVKGVTLEEATISKRGFDARIKPDLGSIDIYREKGVRLDFTKNPTIQLSLLNSKVGFAFGNLSVDLYFGTLLDNAVAKIKDIQSDALQVVNDAQNGGQSGYSWYIDGKKSLASSKIDLSDLSGTLNLDDFTNPLIVLNARADLRKYNSTLFKYVTSAGVENATISKAGFDGELIVGIDELPIWNDKNVILKFDALKPPKFNLSLKNTGIKVGISELDAEIHFGDLLSGTGGSEVVGNLATLGDGTYSWGIGGKPSLNDTELSFKNLRGLVDLSDLKNPIINLDAKVNLSRYGGMFRTMDAVILENAIISKDGFVGDISATMRDITIWSEKRVELGFINGTSPTLNIVMTRDDFDIGISNFNAKLKFGDLLNDEQLTLLSTPNKCEYRWNLENLENPREFYRKDATNVVTVTELDGLMNLCDILDPVVTFNTTADFTNFHFEPDLGVLGIVSVTGATISKNGIDWKNLAFQDASTEFTILELGDGESDDVRAEIVASGSTNNGLESADGVLYFGKLFDGEVERSIELSYLNGADGSKVYGFAFGPDETFTYSSGSDSIVFAGLSGTVTQTGESYAVSITGGTTTLRADALSAMNIDNITATGLSIDNDGFRGILEANWIASNNIDILNGSVTIKISSLALAINSSADMPITLSAFDAQLDLKEFFDESTLADMSYDSSVLAWNFPANTVLHKGKFEFKGLNGSFGLGGSLEDISIGLNGNFGYMDIDSLDIALDDLRIDSGGFTGTVALSNPFNIGTTGVKLNTLSVTFANPLVNTSGSIDASYTKDNFLSGGSQLKFDMLANIDRGGIKDFTLKADGPRVVNVAGFASLSITELGIAPSFNNFWVNLNGSISPSHKLFKGMTLAFQDLKISGDEISIGGGGVSVDVDISASLSGFTMSISRAGLGVDREKGFYLNAFGGLALSVVSADADVTLYSSGELSLGKIATNIDMSGLSGGLELEWYENDLVYGNGFKAGANLTMAEVITLEGSFLIGKTLGDDAYLYWKAEASGGVAGGIPLGALTIYTIGGGFAYNMKLVDAGYIPQSGAYALILKTNLGTSDDGYMWNGDIRIDAQVENNSLSQLKLTGDSWLLSKTEADKADRKISTEITYTPSSLHVTAYADIEYYGINVIGGLDAKFSPADTHLFIGTDNDYAYAFTGATEADLGHITIGVFGIDTHGFFMVNSSAIAFGSGLSINKYYSASWWGPDPSLRIKLEASAKAMAIYNPFSMVIDMGVEVDLRACYGGCLSIGADVKLKVGVNAPSDFLWAKARVRVHGTSFGWSGFVYGHVNTLPEASETPEIVIIDRVTPNKSEDLTIIPELKVFSTFSTEQSISLEYSNVKLVRAGTEISTNIIKNTLSDIDSEAIEKGLVVMPSNRLREDTLYHFTGTVTARYGEDTASETFIKTFRTGDDSFDFQDVVTTISPINNQEHVHEDMGIKVLYSERVISRLGYDSSSIQDFEINVFDSDDNDIRGTFTSATENNQYTSKFQPSRALRVYLYCLHEDGSLKETFVDEHGNFLNPFIGYISDRGDIPNVREIDLAQRGMVSIGSIAGSNRAPSVAARLQAQNAAQETQERDEEENTGIENIRSGVISISSLGNNSLRADLGLAAIPLYISQALVVLNHPEAKGTRIKTSRDMGVSYTYYRANEYKIAVRSKSLDKEVYTSKFKVAYNNIPAENKRKVKEMGEDRLEPAVALGYTDSRGSQSIGMGSNATNPNRVRVVVNSGLEDIGIDISSNSGITTITTVTWNVTSRTGSGGGSGSGTNVSELVNSAMNVDRQLADMTIATETVSRTFIGEGEFLSSVPGVILNVRASIDYMQDDERLLDLPMMILNGEDISAGAQIDVGGHTEDIIIEEIQQEAGSGGYSPRDAAGGNTPWTNTMNQMDSQALDAMDAAMGVNVGTAARGAGASMGANRSMRR